MKVTVCTNIQKVQACKTSNVRYLFHDKFYIASILSVIVPLILGKTWLGRQLLMMHPDPSHNAWVIEVVGRMIVSLNTS